MSCLSHFSFQTLFADAYPPLLSLSHVYLSLSLSCLSLSHVYLSLLSLCLSLSLVSLSISLSLMSLSHVSLSLSHVSLSCLSLSLTCHVCLSCLWGGAVEYTDCTSAEGVRPPPSNECPVIDTKQSDGEGPAVLELWGIRSTPSLPLLPGPLCPGVVAPDRALSMG